MFPAERKSGRTVGLFIKRIRQTFGQGLAFVLAYHDVQGIGGEVVEIATPGGVVPGEIDRH